MEKIVTNFSVNLKDIIEQPKFKTIDDYPKIMESMINEKFIHQQIIKDIERTGINEEMKKIVEKSLKGLIKLIGKEGKNAKNSEKSRTIQKNSNKNKKNKCQSDN